ncbi:UNVERIFIED_CONTAM: (+)-bornyl diphosphate synthase, chloroplastic [Sesamum angustifolium]|uniref:(+)-bornyl diphosphate synthase, chloroplastic n=1 Tax=Sesamum angustifolium TaxID=2727405 RepID=A0AAW2JV79_9LAMI
MICSMKREAEFAILYFIAAMFDCFRNEKGDFDPSLGHDTKGLLQLYEASFLSTPGEKTLDLAREFATNFLQKNPNEKIDESLSILVRHAFELPRHWRVQRPNTRWFIEAYERSPDVNRLVLELAKLDFNIVQTTHQQEPKHVYEWWSKQG